MSKELITEERFEEIKHFFLKGKPFSNKVTLVRVEDYIPSPDCLALNEIEFFEGDNLITQARVVVLTHPDTIDEYFQKSCVTEEIMQLDELSIPFVLKTEDDLVDWMIAEELAHILISSLKSRDELLDRVSPSFKNEDDNTHEQFPIEIVVSRIALQYFINKYPERADELKGKLKASIKNKKAIQPYYTREKIS